MMLCSNTKVKFRLPDGYKNFFEIVARVLQDPLVLAPYLSIIRLACVGACVCALVCARSVPINSTDYYLLFLRVYVCVYFSVSVCA